jgi:hypothetical protein
VILSSRSGIDPDEHVLQTVSCKYQKFRGELVLTNKGVIFLKPTGFFQTGRERLHFFILDELQGVRIEKQGVFGYNIAIDHRSLAWGNRTYRYFCSQIDANSFIEAIESQKSHLRIPEELETKILSLIKPKGEADLYQVARDETIHNLITRLYASGQRGISQDQVFMKVRDTVVSLIANGSLDGIITDENRYISNALLARKSVQYQVVIDFNSLYAQLENKGIILQTLECPSCGGKLNYPKEGDTITCQFCQATVHAIDVFKKFKELL